MDDGEKVGCDVCNSDTMKVYLYGDVILIVCAGCQNVVAEVKRVESLRLEPEEDGP